MKDTGMKIHTMKWFGLVRLLCACMVAFFGGDALASDVVAGAGHGGAMDLPARPACFDVDEGRLSLLDQALLRRLVTKTRNDGYTLLHMAALQNTEWSFDIARCALYWGADVSAAATKGKDTPLHIAAGLGNIKIMSVLMFCGARQDAIDDAGKTPQDIALENGKIGEYVAASVAAKAYAEATMTEEKLFSSEMQDRAISKVWEETKKWATTFCVQFLPDLVFEFALLCGVCADFVDEKGNTILHTIMEHLPHCDGEILLNLATIQNIGSVIQNLCDLGVKIESLNRNYQTVGMMALSKGYNNCRPISSAIGLRYYPDVYKPYYGGPKVSSHSSSGGSSYRGFDGVPSYIRP